MHRPDLPFFAWYVCGNAFIVCGWMLEIIGILSIDKRVARLESFYKILATIGIADFFFNWWINASLSTINFSISVLLIFTFIIPVVKLMHKSEATSLSKSIGAFYLLYCIVNILRAGYSLNTNNVSIMVGTWMHTLIFISLFSLLVVGTIGYMLLLREKSEKDLVKAATLDPLTGAFNRRAFISHCELALKISKRNQSPVCFLMIDIDHFKKINDKHGHAAGDLVLKELTLMILKSTREQDVFGRLGGEEFALLVHGDEKIGLEVAERIRSATERMQIDKYPEIKYTVSIGSHFSPAKDIHNLEELMAKADKRLYQAKESGRNKVV